MLDIPAHHNGMVFAHISCQKEEFFQFFLVGTHIHGCTGQHIRRSHQYREAHPADEFIDIVHTCERTPFRLVDAIARQHRREFGTVFGMVDILRRGAEYGKMLLIEPYGKVVRNLSAC